jgi:hypothetical protein
MAMRPRKSERNAFRLAYWNVDCVRSRKLQLEQFLSEHGVDICLLNETHLELVRALRNANCVVPSDGRPDSGRRHSDPCPVRHRSLCRASLGMQHL